MGQEMEGLKLLLLLGKDQAATPGNRFCVLAAIEVLGEGQQCQVEGEGKALVWETIPSAVPDSCLLRLALQDKTLLYSILSLIHCTKPGIICCLE